MQLSKSLNFASLTALFVLYAFLCPLFLQSGDTSELVNASYNLLVPHPPGYPLFLWIVHLWTKFFAVSTIFWRASFLSSILSVTLIGFLCSLVKERKLWFLIPILMLGLNQNFVEASILPDVFALHALLIGSIGICFLFKKCQRWIPLLMLLSCANHHTTILIIPCYFVLVWESRSDRQEFISLLKMTVIGLVLAVALYASLILCHPEHPMSWGVVKDLPSLIHHFLRKDYGTFKLSAGKESPFGEAFLFLLKDHWAYLGIFSVGIYFSLKFKLWKNLRFCCWTFCLVLTILFPLLMNVLPVNVGKEVLTRFHVMPLVVFTVWLLFVLMQGSVKSLFLISILPVIVVNLINLQSFQGFRNDSVVEDYSFNLLEGAKKHTPSILILNNDSSFFAARFLQMQDESKEAKEVLIVAPSLLFHPWMVEKLKMMAPNFKLNDEQKIYSTKRLHLENDFVFPNIKDFNFVANAGFKDGESYKVTFLGLGRVVQQGKGIFFDEKSVGDLSLQTKLQVYPTGPQAFTRGYLYYQYSHFYLAKAFNEPSVHKQNLEQAMKLVPFAYPAASTLCQLPGNDYKFCGEDSLNEMDKLTKHFY
jgi:hypothetical protein